MKKRLCFYFFINKRKDKLITGKFQRIDCCNRLPVARLPWCTVPNSILWSVSTRIVFVLYSTVPVYCTVLYNVRVQSNVTVRYYRICISIHIEVRGTYYIHTIQHKTNLNKMKVKPDLFESCFSEFMVSNIFVQMNWWAYNQTTIKFTPVNNLQKHITSTKVSGTE